MKQFYRWAILPAIFITSLALTSFKGDQLFEANHEFFQYTGRIDFSNAKSPRMWAAGIYIKAAFTGSSCEIEVDDEMKWGVDHNYLEISIDGHEPIRIKLTERHNTLSVGEQLTEGEHTIIITKGTEALIGYIEFKGIRCKQLRRLSPKPGLRIEFFGDSITSGMGSITSVVPCDGGKWYDQHSAWFSYAAITARNLSAEYHLTSESGLGLIHSCCNKIYTMPRVYDKMNIANDSMRWDFSKFQPDIVAICLGQNDGKQDSVKFTSAYISFIGGLRRVYPKAAIVCLTSPMADQKLRQTLSSYLDGIVAYCRGAGDKNVEAFTFDRSYNHGCGGHPDKKDHQMIADKLTPYLAKLKRN